MADIFDVAQVVSDAKDLVDAGADARKRQPIGFWRAAIAIGAGALWIVPGIIPGIPVMISADRWMKGKSRRPLVAMIFGYVAVVFMTVAMVFLLLGAALEAVLGRGAGVGTTLSSILSVVALVAGAAVAWFVGRFLFRPCEPKPAPQNEPEADSAIVAPEA